MLQHIALVSALLLAAPLFVTGPARAQTTPLSTPRVITISATGSVSARPDQAEVSIGVSSNAATAKAALAANTLAMRPVIDKLKAAGIEDKDIQTSNFNLQPTYLYTQDGKPPKLTGYQVTNSVEVRVREISKLGELLDVVVGEGSNQISGIAFVVSKAGELRDAARKDAVANATRMARTYAGAAGVALGDVLSIEESGGEQTYRPMPATMARAKAAGPAPIEAGEQELTATVTMVWAIK